MITANARLKDLLSKLFSTDELRLFVNRYEDYRPLSAGLPGNPCSHEGYCQALVESLDRHGLVTDTLRKRLNEARPKQRSQVSACFKNLSSAARNAGDSAASSNPAEEREGRGVTTVQQSAPVFAPNNAGTIYNIPQAGEKNTFTLNMLPPTAATKRGG